MWLPLLLKSLNESEMKAMGMKMSAEDIYSVNHGSLKDAVCQFNGGCTAEVISAQGLILTNHHCGYSAIQAHSSLEHNYLKDGYWAKNKGEELPNPGMFVQFIIRMEEVTSQVLEGVDDQMSAPDRQSLIDKNSQRIMQNLPKEAWQDIMIRSFFDGNRYYAFVTETYKDIRFVGSPPESIGKFGADTDNWVWPRHTGDFSVFRIYAGPDNRPAEYSPDNKPFQPRHFFPISLDGIAEGDFTLIFGFPGRTTQYLPSFAVGQVVDLVDPARIGVRNISLGIMDKYMREDEGIKLAYSAKYASLSNAWKKWIGEVQGLTTKHAVAIKERQESEFQRIVDGQPTLSSPYGDLLPRMRQKYSELDPIIQNRTILGEFIGGANLELFRLAATADRLINAYKENGEEGFSKAAAKTKEGLPGFYKNYSKKVDMEIFDALMAHISKTVAPAYLPTEITDQQKGVSPPVMGLDAATLYSASALPDEKKLMESLGRDGGTFARQMASDPAYQLYLSFKRIMDRDLTPVSNKINEQLQILQKSYMQALMEAYPGKRYWPDANSTLRVAYGKVEPYAPRDGMTYKIQTYLDGVMEKYKPGDYEFDVPARLIDLFEKKDYGPYGENGKMPVAFIASNHTTGGNSGSPAIDARGNLIGINFDRVWEGTMSDLYYDPSICRNIMVDIRYVLFIMDKYAGASNLIAELKLVHPKGGKKRKK